LWHSPFEAQGKHDWLCYKTVLEDRCDFQNVHQKLRISRCHFELAAGKFLTPRHLDECTAKKCCKMQQLFHVEQLQRAITKRIVSFAVYFLLVSSRVRRSGQRTCGCPHSGISFCTSFITQILRASWPDALSMTSRGPNVRELFHVKQSLQASNSHFPPRRYLSHTLVPQQRGLHAQSGAYF
jgi:hypothetical protein